MPKTLRSLLCIVLILMMFIPAGCSRETTYNQTVVEKFTEALVKQDFKKAHEYFWPYADYEKSEVFVEECEYIVDRLGVTDISISNVTVTERDDETLLEYTCALTTAEAGTVTSEVSAHIVIEDRNTYIAYAHGLLLEGFEHGCTISRSLLESKRGEIITSDGKAVAINDYADSVCIRVSEDLNITRLLSDVDAVLDLSEKDLSKAKSRFESTIKNNYGTSVITTYSRGSIDAATEEALCAIDGVFVDRDSVTYQRYYPEKNLYYHAVGYTGTPDEEQTEFLSENGYSSSSVFGKEGLESAYNESMLGKDGYRITIRDKDNNIMRTLFEKPAEDGELLELTLDSELQETAYYAITGTLSEEQTAAVIALDPTTGAVKSYVSYPSVDPNIFSSSISDAEYAAITDEDGGLPLFNRASLGLYPPGSVIKPFIGGLAIDEGLINENTQFPYEISHNKWTPENWHWPAITRNTDSGSPLVLKNAISESDNIYFAWLGLKIGAEKMCAFLESIGFGTKQAFDLPTSTSKLMNEDTEMIPVLLTDMAIGHGELLVTPIQIASLYTAFVNDGDVLQPYMTENGERTVLYEEIISPYSISKMKPGLREAVTDGTARSARIKDFEMYSKTGTAIKQENTEERISWICIWGENNGESLLTVVMVDGPNGQDSAKFKIAKSVMEAFYESTK